jgi:hypothetical protein
MTTEDEQFNKFDTVLDCYRAKFREDPPLFYMPSEGIDLLAVMKAGCGCSFTTKVGGSTFTFSASGHGAADACLESGVGIVLDSV